MKLTLLLLIVKAQLPLLALAWFSAPILAFLHKYVFYDWEFMACMALLVVFDTATGFWAAWRLEKIYSKKMWGVPIKIVLYGVSLIVTHIISISLVERLPIAAQAAGTDIAQYIDCSVYCFLMFREALSINENLGKMGMAFLPKFLMKRIKDFDETGTFIPGQPVPLPMDAAKTVAQEVGAALHAPFAPAVTPLVAPLQAPEIALQMPVSQPAPSAWGGTVPTPPTSNPS